MRSGSNGIVAYNSNPHMNSPQTCNQGQLFSKGTKIWRVDFKAWAGCHWGLHFARFPGSFFFPECVARVPVSLGGLGVRLCSPSFAFAVATVRNRPQPLAVTP